MYELLYVYIYTYIYIFAWNNLDPTGHTWVKFIIDFFLFFHENSSVIKIR